MDISHTFTTLLVVTSEEMYPRRSRTVHQGFRIQEEIIRRLENQADKKGITLSSLVNKILKNYVTRDMYFEELNFILIGKDTLRTVFEETELMSLVNEARELG